MEDVYPVEAKLMEAEGLLKITWSDEHTSDFPLAYLRGWCPCAGCQGHFNSEMRYIETATPPVLLNAVPVGNYAMRLQWGDGHDTGIYTFDYLRRMCPSPALDPQGENLKDRVRSKAEWTK